MKKIVALALAAFTFAACNNEAEEGLATDTNETTPLTTTSENAAYEAGEGDVSWRDGKLMVYRNNGWVESNEDVNLDNGARVTRNGRAMREGNEVELGEGVVVNRRGEFFDNTGRAIDNAWEQTKVGVRNAAEAVGDAAKDAGREIEKATDRNQ